MQVKVTPSLSNALKCLAESAESEWAVGDLGQLIHESPKYGFTCWIHVNEFKDDGSPFSERVKGNIDIGDGDALFSPRIDSRRPNQSTVMVQESNTLSGAVDNLRHKLATVGLPGDGVDSIRPTLSYMGSEAWLRRQPGYDADTHKKLPGSHGS